MRIACLSMHPAPYRDPMLSRIQARMGDDFDIINLYEMTTHTEWNLSSPPYRAILLRTPVSLFGHIDYHFGILGALSAKKYDIVVVPGHFPLTCVAAIGYALIARRKLIYCSDAVSAGRLTLANRSIGRVLGTRANAIWVPGRASRSMWEGFGVRSDAIFEGYYTLSTDEIDRSIEDSRSSQSLRELYDIRDKFVYLFVGNLSRNRAAARLARAYASIGSQDTALLIIGKGEQEPEISEMIRQNPGLNIHLIEPVPFAHLHAYYGIADAYVHAGREPYSLALQEAAFLGIPVVATRSVGATVDFIYNYANGILIDANDIQQLERALVDVRQMSVSDEAKQVARGRSVDFAVDQFRSMLEYVSREEQ